MQFAKKVDDKKVILLSQILKKADRHKIRMRPIWREGKPLCPRCKAEMVESDGILSTVCTFTCRCGHVC